MAEYDLAVLNGLVVNASGEDSGALDIFVKDGKIAELVPRGGEKGLSAKKTIDAQGGMVMVKDTVLDLGAAG